MVNCRRFHGFSLTEILVVVAIIAVLLAILLPGLSRAKDHGYRAVCTAHLRQFALAVRGYAADSVGFMPAPNDDNTSYKFGWLYTGPSLPKPAKPSDVEGGTIYKYFSGADTGGGSKPSNDKRYSAYHCPADPPPWRDPWNTANPADGRAHALTSYQMNFAVTGFGNLSAPPGSPAPPALRLEQMRPDGALFWECDETGQLSPGNELQHLWSDGTNYPYNGLTRRHGGGASIATFSGATHWFSRKDFDDELKKAPSRLWCSPLSSNGK